VEPIGIESGVVYEIVMYVGCYLVELIPEIYAQTSKKLTTPLRSIVHTALLIQSRQPHRLPDTVLHPSKAERLLFKSARLSLENGKRFRHEC